MNVGDDFPKLFLVRVSDSTTYPLPHMMLTRIKVLLLTCLLLIPAMHAPSQDPVDVQEETAVAKTPEIFKALEGKWAGTCRTWFQPGKLADESEVAGDFQLILGGRFLRHTYDGKILGKSRTGEETIAFNSITEQFECSWFDDFHMSNGIMFSKGPAAPSGFEVSGNYSVGPDMPDWGWKTVFNLEDKDHLTITAYNVTPDGKEGKAVETKYVRKDVK